LGSQTYVCKSQKAYDACKSASADCSACESKDSATGTVITNACAKINTTTFQVSSAGCVSTTEKGSTTNVCTNTTTLKSLTGTGLTKDKVVSTGASFTTATGSVSIDHYTYQCS